jgi:uncharacterized membrane protein
MADARSKDLGRFWRVVLVVSLCLNLAVAGIVAGLGIRDRVWGKPPRGIELAMGPLGAALERDDRHAIIQALRANPDLPRPGRDQLHRSLDALGVLLRAETVDEAQLRTVLDMPSNQLAELRAATRDALIARILAMTPDARIALADRLAQQVDMMPSRR